MKISSGMPELRSVLCVQRYRSVSNVRGSHHPKRRIKAWKMIYTGAMQ